MFEKCKEPEWVGVEFGKSFKEIFKAVQISWGRMATRLRFSQFQVCGRLARARKSNVIVDGYLQSVEKCSRKAYLIPISPFLPELDSALVMKIPIGDWSNCVVSSPVGATLHLGLDRILRLCRVAAMKRCSARGVTRRI